MKQVMPLAILLTACAFQAPAFQAPSIPPMKMGLWESKASFPVRQADGTDKLVGRTVRSCVTPQNWVTLMGPTAAGACPKVKEAWTRTSYSFDVTCPGKPRMASVAIQFDTPETQHGTLDMFALPDGSPTKLHQDFTEDWIGSDCGDVSPDHPVPVR